MKTKRIAGVSVNTEELPTREELVSSALKSKEYYRMPQEEAIEAINSKIDESGLYNSVSEPATEDNKPKRDRKTGRKPGNSKLRGSDTNS